MNIQNFKKLVEPYGIYIDTYESKYSAKENSIGQSVSITSNLELRETVHNTMDQRLINDVKLLSAVRQASNDADIAIKDAYDKLMTIIALKK